MPTHDDPSRKTHVGQHVLQAPNAWRVLVLLSAANLLNYYDRAVPAILVESLKAEFRLTDLAVGTLSAAFTIVYALFSIPLGRLADQVSRKKVMGWGLVAWSALTAATGAAWNIASLLLLRLGVGVGEASYAPAANSTIADLFPAQKRARAVGLHQLGLPVGLILAYFTVGSIATVFGSWRAPFVVAAVPGIILAICFFHIREPLRGAAEPVPVTYQPEPVDHPFRRLITVPTMWWLIVAGMGVNLAAYSVNTFTVPLFQRYFGLPLMQAAVMTGLVVGLTGLVGLLVGGVAADRADRHSASARVVVGAVGTLSAAVLTFFALRVDPDGIGVFVMLFGVGWLLQYLYFTSKFPAIADVVPPGLRSTAIAVASAASSLMGGALGPVFAGGLSDAFARTAAEQGATSAQAAAEGLRQSLAIIVPISLLIAAIGLFLASITVGADNARLKASMTAAIHDED